MSRSRLATLLVTLLALVGWTAMSAPASDAERSAVVATWHLAPGGYELHAGLNAMWVANVDEFHYGKLYRIDPATNDIVLVTTLPFPPGDMTTAFGSIWVTDYYGNAVWRVAPDGHVLATIRTGLQPQWMTAAFGSLWTSNHHSGSLTRVDPSTDTAVATIPVGARHTFRDGPQAVTHDADRVYVGSSNLFTLQAVDPTDNTVSTPAHPAGNDQFCGPMVVAGGRVWSMDLCTPALYQLTKDGTVRVVVDGGSAIQQGVTVLDGTLWVSEDQDPDTSSHAALVQRDPRTGDELRIVPIGGDAFDVQSGFGDLWVFDSVLHTVRRVHV